MSLSDLFFFFFKQKTAYELTRRDWSSDVCSSDLPVPVACGAFVTFHPSFGSMVSYDRGLREGLPAYVSMPEVSRSGGPNFLGAQHAPFVIDGYPNTKGFKVRDVVLPSDISEGRAANRQVL